MSWTFFPAFIGTLISIGAWTYLARREHIAHVPRTLSELASEKPEALKYYRIVLWVCGPLFAVTTLFFIVPRIENQIAVGAACALTVLAELLIGIYPAQRGKITTHDLIAGLMGAAMLASAYLFAFSLGAIYSHIEISFAIIMTILAALTILDRKRYLFYELPFIFIAHGSILVAALALR
ncbi:MAG: hypothetical protein WDN27_06130 [Candidatus Saccharibacteria bacterium]